MGKTVQTTNRAELGVTPSNGLGAAKWLEAVVDVSRQIANLEELPTVLKSIVDAAMQLVSSDVAVVALLNHNRSRLIIERFAARSSHSGTAQVGNTVDTPIISRAVHKGQALRFPEDRLEDEVSWYCPLLDQPVKAAAVVPLKLDGTPIGVLWVACHQPASFTRADVVRLSHLADQTVIALEHASMTSKIQSIAITEERYRIAREMHDSLSQVLAYLNLQMQTLELLVKAGDKDQLLAELATARRSIKVAHEDVRDSIVSLRTTLSDDLSLPDALKEYAIEFAVQTGLDIHFHSTTDATPPLTPRANVEVVRIVQEALTNIRKHAQATTVDVQIVAQAKDVVITVCDDGVGFDLTADKPHHFGLSTMRERARHIGGMTHVTSKVGQGTIVTLRVPLAQTPQ